MCGHRVANATGFDVVRCVCSVVTNIGAKAQDIEIVPIGFETSYVNYIDFLTQMRLCGVLLEMQNQTASELVSYFYILRDLIYGYA